MSKAEVDALLYYRRASEIKQRDMLPERIEHESNDTRADRIHSYETCRRSRWNLLRLGGGDLAHMD